MANRYWVGGTGVWDTGATTHWSSSSGGAGGASPPSVNDSAFFDVNSCSNGDIITVQDRFVFPFYDLPTIGNLNFTGVASITIAYNITHNPNPSGLTLVGNLTGAPTVTFSDFALRIVNAASYGFGSSQITSNGMLFDTLICRHPGTFHADTGTVVLMDDLNVRVLLVGGTDNLLSQVTFNANGNNVAASHTATALGSITLRGTGTLTMGSGTWTTPVFDIDGPGPFFPSEAVTVNGDTSTLNILAQDHPTAGDGVSGLRSTADVVFHNVRLKKDSGERAYLWGVYSPTTMTATSFVVDAGIFVEFLNIFTHIDTSTFTANGTPTTYIAISGGNISATTASVSYVAVTNNTASGAGIPFNDIVGGSDGGGNTNWLFPTYGGHLTQTGLPLVAGQTYKLTFEADVSAGTLYAFVGVIPVINTSLTPLRGIMDSIHVSEHPIISVSPPAKLLVNVFDALTVSENTSITKTFFSIYDSVTITEVVTMTIV